MKNNKTSLKRKAYGVTMNVLMGVAVTLTCALVLFLIVYILYKGLPNITWELLSTSPSYLSGTIGILPDILIGLETFTGKILETDRPYRK